MRPRKARIPDAIKYSGIKRSSLYLLAPKHEGLFCKFGHNVLVDMDILDRILDGLPAAKIKSQEKTAA